MLSVGLYAIERRQSVGESLKWVKDALHENFSPITGGHAIANSSVFHIGVGGFVFGDALLVFYFSPLGELIIVQAVEFWLGKRFRSAPGKIQGWEQHGNKQRQRDTFEKKGHALADGVHGEFPFVQDIIKHLFCTTGDPQGTGLVYSNPARFSRSLNAWLLPNSARISAKRLLNWIC